MQKMNKYVLAVFMAALLSGHLYAKVMEGSVATVNGRPILASEYNTYVDAVVDQYKATAPETLAKPYAGDIIGKNVLNDLITKELMYQAAEEAKVQVKDSEIDAGINEIKTRFMIDEKTGKEDPAGADKRFNAELKKQGLTLKRYKEKIKKDVAVRKMMSEKLRTIVKPVEKADAEALYNNVEIVLKNNTKKIKELEKSDPAQLQEVQLIAAKVQQLTAERVRIGHIYLAITKDMKPEDVKVKEELAKKIKKEIDDGLDFAAAVQKYTEDKAALASGGDMILIKGVAPKAVDDKAFTLAVGKVSTPIKSDVGIHIIKIKEKRAAQTITFNDIAQDLGQYLAQKRIQQAMDGYVKELNEKADIKITKTFEIDKAIAEKEAAAAQTKTPDKKTK